MFSIIIGYAIGHRVTRLAVGLPLVAIYGIGTGIIIANATYRDNAILTVPILALIGYLLARCVRWVRSVRAAKT